MLLNQKMQRSSGEHSLKNNSPKVQQFNRWIAFEFIAAIGTDLEAAFPLVGLSLNSPTCHVYFQLHFSSDQCHFPFFLKLKTHIVWKKSKSFFLYFNRNSWNKFLFVFNAYMLHFHLPLKWSKGTRQYAPYSAMTVDRLENFETPLILHWIQSYF